MRYLLFIPLFLVSLLPPDPAFGCSVCIAGDSAYSVLGQEADHPGRLRLSNENLYLEKRQGAESHSEWRSYLGVAYGISEKLTLALTVPWVWKRLNESGTSLATRGVGDTEFLGRYTVWQDRYLAPTHVFRVSGGAQTPTGNYWLRADKSLLDSPAALDSSPSVPKKPWGRKRLGEGRGNYRALHAGEDHTVESASGELLAPEHSQIGSGAFVAVVGADYQHWRDELLLGSGAFLRVPTRSPRGFRYGTHAVVTTTALYEVQSAFLLGGGPTYRWADYDRLNGAIDANSGGHVVYLEPTAVGRFAPWLSARLKVGFPVVQILHGDQEEQPVYGLTLQSDVPL